MSGAAERPALAAITVTHDSTHVLPAWIDALNALPERDRLELCVVDSGSSREELAATRKLAERYADAFVALPNAGYGMACNAGAAATKGRTLFFCNPDARVLSLPARSLNGTLGGTMLSGFATDPERPLGFAKLPTWGQEAQELALGPWSRAYERCVEPQWVSGAALMMDRTAFEQIGGFSPAFFMYFEDADLCARHSRAGGTVELDEGLRIAHRSGQSTSESQRAVIDAALESVNRLSGRRFAARYGGRWQAPALYLLLALAYIPRRVLLDLWRRRLPPWEIPKYVAYLLLPWLARRKLRIHTGYISPARP